jgi:putative ABC transport system permease protein
MYTGVMLVKIQGTGQSNALSCIEKVWNQINPDVPFEYHFLDQAYEQLYSAEQRTQVIFNWFCVVAIVVASLGLYGLASFMAESRKREIGIRKTLGADVKTIVVSLTVDFAKLVLLANIIAWPLAWFVMNKWLQDFAYRTDMHWWIFSSAGMAALAIAMAAVGFRALQAAMIDPVEALRHE